VEHYQIKIGARTGGGVGVSRLPLYHRFIFVARVMYMYGAITSCLSTYLGGVVLA
jgi:hypothetical protein